MKVIIRTLISIAVLSMIATSAVAGGQLLKQQVYGPADPPAGYAAFCSRHAIDCRKVASAPNFEPTPEQFLKMDFIQKSVNATLEQVSDQDLYGTIEYWEYPVDAGDCEDIALRKKQLLIDSGFPKGALRITVVLDENRGGHAVLSVLTKQKDYVLDNKTFDVVLWNQTKYRFLARQSISGRNADWERIEAITASTN